MNFPVFLFWFFVVFMEIVCLVGIYLCLKKEVKKADKLLFYSLIIITPFVLGSWIYFEVLDQNFLKTKTVKQSLTKKDKVFYFSKI